MQSDRVYSAAVYSDPGLVAATIRDVLPAATG